MDRIMSTSFVLLDQNSNPNYVDIMIFEHPVLSPPPVSTSRPTVEVIEYFSSFKVKLYDVEHASFEVIKIFAQVSKLLSTFVYWLHLKFECMLTKIQDQKITVLSGRLASAKKLFVARFYNSKVDYVPEFWHRYFFRLSLNR